MHQQWYFSFLCLMFRITFLLINVLVKFSWHKRFVFHAPCSLELAQLCLSPLALWLVATVYCVNKTICRCQRLERVFGPIWGFLSKEKCIENNNSGVKDCDLMPFKGVNIKIRIPFSQKKHPQTRKFSFSKVALGPPLCQEGIYKYVPQVRGQQTFSCKGLDSNYVALAGHTHLLSPVPCCCF